jgi:hypothetical protein
VQSLSLFLPRYRIPHFADRAAKQLHLSLCVVVSFGFLVILFGAWINERGLNYEVFAFLQTLMSLVVMVLNAALVVMNRKAITTAIRVGTPYLESSLVIQLVCSIWVSAVLALFGIRMAGAKI